MCGPRDGNRQLQQSSTGMAWGNNDTLCKPMLLTTREARAVVCAGQRTERGRVNAGHLRA